MKKWLVIISGVILAFIGGVYVFIPNVITLKSSIGINTTQKGLQRMLLNNKNVANWWPGIINKDSFYLNGYSYQIHDNNITLLPIIIENKEISIKSTLFFISIQIDSLNLEWVGQTITFYNPVKRFNAYLEARQINNDMDMVLQKIKQYYSLPENIYGFDIRKELVVDANLISTSLKCKGFPGNEFIYGLIRKLEEYANEQNTKITGYPMLNIEPSGSAGYLVRVALPLEKIIPDKGDILQKRMPKNGNILVTETKGGNLKAKEAFDQIILYANDYNRTSPAIPFYSLITDRTKEPDSTKWITKIYYPVR
jgi:hypothetical protein